jgi:hypothetical protein
MPGGTWLNQNKLLPGVYINFRTTPGMLATVGERGIAAIAQQLSWGDGTDIIDITDVDQVFTKLGYDITSPQMLFVRQMMRGTTLTSGASRLLVYRLPTSGATAASAVFGLLTATAKYVGARGNDISIIISPDVDTEYGTDLYAVFTVQTVVDGAVVDSQTVGSFTDITTNTPGAVGMLVNNDWVNFTGNSTDLLTPSAGAPLTGGADGTVLTTAYSSFLTLLDQYHLNVLIYDGTDPVMQSSVALYVQNRSYGTGRYCQAVMAAYPSADNETVISVKNAISLLDGTVLTPQQATWWVGGATAGASYNQSLTYGVHPDATAPVPRLTMQELNDAVTEGSFVFFEENGAVKVLTDINTFTSFTPTKGRSFRKNRVIRVLFSLANDIYRTFSLYYIGKTDNNADGRNLFKAEIIGYCNQLQGNNALQNFSADDVEVLPGNDVDSIVVNLAVQPVDAVEKIYMTVTVN